MFNKTASCHDNLNSLPHPVPSAQYTLPAAISSAIAADILVCHDATIKINGASTWIAQKIVKWNLSTLEKNAAVPGTDGQLDSGTDGLQWHFSYQKCICI